MNPELWRQIERIYHLALERPPRERESLLADQCHGDESLRFEVDSLLRRNASAENCLDQSATALASPLASITRTFVRFTRLARPINSCSSPWSGLMGSRCRRA